MRTSAESALIAGLPASGGTPTLRARTDQREVAELKAWSRRVWWAAHDTPRRKAGAFVTMALSPWRFVREVTRVFPRYAPFVSRRFGVSAAAQLAGLVWARLRHGLDPIAYYRFQLFRRDRFKRANAYVQTGDTGRVLRWLVERTPGYVFAFGDKRRFERWCVQNDLPTVRTIAEFERGTLTRALAEDGTLPPYDLFSKPSNWQAGLGTQRWMYRDGRYVGSDGQPRSAAELCAELARQSADIQRPVLLQRALQNASHDARLTPGALCTARMTTMCMPGGEPQLLFAVYRMPAEAGAPVDNFGYGGLSALIDLESGRLHAAIRKDFLLTPEPVAAHPHTGAPIEGHHLSRWQEAVDLVLRAHRAITWKGVPIIGWDVALLDDGPMLVEANNVPCSTFAQMVMETPLGDLPLVACLNAHLRECFASPRPAR